MHSLKTCRVKIDSTLTNLQNSNTLRINVMYETYVQPLDVKLK